MLWIKDVDGICSSYIIYDNFLKSEKEYSEEPRGHEEIEYITRNYAINDYAKLSIDDNQMSIIYFTDYKQYLTHNIEKAYELVDPEYATKKFRDISDFKNYVSNRYNNSKVKKYKVNNKEDYTYDIIGDTDNNYIVFKVDGVMNYTVYLDNETVVIQWN